MKIGTRLTIVGIVLLLLASTLYITGNTKATGVQQLTGYVYNQNGLPVPNIQNFPGIVIKLYSAATGSIVAVNETVNGGEYSFNVQPGYYKIIIPSQTLTLPNGVEVTYTPTTTMMNYVYVGLNDNVSVGPLHVYEHKMTSYVRGTVLLPGITSPTQSLSVKLYDISNNYELTTTAMYNGTLKLWNYNITTYNGTFAVESVYPGYSPFNSGVVTVNVPVNSGVYYNITMNTTFIEGYTTSMSNKNIVVSNMNVTLYNTSYHMLYNVYIPGKTSYYSIGAFEGNFTMFVSANGYNTNVSNVKVTSSGYVSRNVVLTPLNHTEKKIANITVGNFGNASERNNITLNEFEYISQAYSFTSLNYSYIHYLPAQIALSFSGGSTINLNTTINSSFKSWLTSRGPFYVPSQNNLNVNGTPFVNISKATTGNLTNASINLLPDGSVAISYNNMSYGSLTSISASDSYNLSTVFTHPHSTGLLLYNIRLSNKSYVVTNYSVSNAVVSSNNNRWYNFTLKPEKNSAVSSVAYFYIQKIKNITAIANVSASFFGVGNVLNSTRNNYTVIVKKNENITFSAQNSIVPVGNITEYSWSFGDKNVTNTTKPTIIHTYKNAGKYNGTLTITGSGGQVNTTKFYILVDGAPPTVIYHANVTKGTNPRVIWVKWGETVSFNTTGSYDTINNGTLHRGKILNYTWIFGNKTISTSVNGSISYTFLAYGHYLNYTMIGTKNITFHGWKYNASLKVYDVAGNLKISNFTVLVNDTQLPVPIINITNSEGVSVTSVLEGTHIKFNASSSYEAGGGVIRSYKWTISYTNNNTVYLNKSVSTFTITLPPAIAPYKVLLNVTTLAGKYANTSVLFTVSVNKTLTPILQVSNLTAPSNLQVGSSAVLSVLITNVGGVNSSAENISAIFNVSGNVINSASSVSFYSTNGTLLGQGLSFKLLYNKTVKAEITWTPTKAGTSTIGVNVTCLNEWSPDYLTTKNSMSITVSVAQSTLYDAAIYGGVIAVIVVIIVVIYFIYRKKMSPKLSGKKKGDKVQEWKGPSNKDKSNKTTGKIERDSNTKKDTKVK